MKVWKPDPISTYIRRRLGPTSKEPGTGRSRDETASGGGTTKCPGIWELDNGDIAIIGRDVTDEFQSKLPEGVKIHPNEKMVVLPPGLLILAKPDLPDDWPE